MPGLRLPAGPFVLILQKDVTEMKETKVILFQGDSITDAGRLRENENTPNGLHHSFGVGYPLLASARLLADQPDAGFQIYNRGISGNRVVDLYARWKIDALNLNPDLLSIFIGVNDLWHEKMRRNGVEPVRFERIYRMLLEWTLEVLPEVKLILIEPYVLPCGSVEESWIPEIAEYQKIVRKLADEFKTGFVPTQEIFNTAAKTAPSMEYLTADGVHPTPAGHQLLADAWLAEARKQGFLK